MLNLWVHLASVSASIFLLVACLHMCLCVFVCMCVRVCADTRQHSQALDGTPMHALVLGALPVHMSERFLGRFSNPIKEQCLSAVGVK